MNLTLSIKEKEHKKFKKFCEATGRTLSKSVRNAMEDYIEKNGWKNEE